MDIHCILHVYCIGLECGRLEVALSRDPSHQLSENNNVTIWFFMYYETQACFQSPSPFLLADVGPMGRLLLIISNTTDVSSSNSPKVLVGLLHTPISHQNSWTSWCQDMPRPDVVTFNVTMSACEKVTSWLDAVVLLQEVSKQETFGAGEGGRWCRDEVFYFRKMPLVAKKSYNLII